MGGDDHRSALAGNTRSQRRCDSTGAGRRQRHGLRGRPSFALPVVGTTPFDWAIVAYLGVIQIGLAYVCFSIGMAGVPALEASLLLLLEPVLNPLWSWLVHDEVPNRWSLHRRSSHLVRHRSEDSVGCVGGSR